MMILGWLALRKHSRVQKVVRVAAYATMVSGIAAAVTVHSAHASVGEASMQLGRDLLPLADYIQDATAISINGEHIMLSSSHSDKTVNEVLDAYENYCNASPDSRAADWGKLITGPGADTVKASKIGLDVGTFRRQNGSQGSVMCFMHGEQSQKTIADSIKAFAQTKDLGKLGKLRYVYVSPDENGSRVLTAWTDDVFKIDSLVPKDKHTDAAGADPIDVPRPPEAQRLLAAQVLGTPFGAHIYRSAKGPDAVRDFYDGELSKAGWLPLGWYDDKIATGKHRLYMKGDVQVALATQEQSAEQGGGSVVSVGEVGVRPNDIDTTPVVQPME